MKIIKHIKRNRKQILSFLALPIMALFSRSLLISSSIELNATDPMTGLFSPQQYLAENADVPYFFGVRYNNAKEKPEAVLELMVSVNDSLDITERYHLENRWKSRLEYAGYPAEIEPVEPNKYQFLISGVFNPEQIEDLVTSNLEVSVSETDCSAAETLFLLLMQANDSLQHQSNEFFTPAFNHGSSAAGYCLVDDTAKVICILNEQYGFMLPEHSRLTWQDGNDNGYVSLYCLKNEKFGGSAISVNDDVENIELSRCHDCPGLFSLHFKLGPTGSMLWNKLATRNIGQALAITINNKVHAEIFPDPENEGGAFSMEGLSWDGANNLRAGLLGGSVCCQISITDQHYTPPVIHYKKAKWTFRLAIGLAFVCLVLVLILLHAAYNKIILLATSKINSVQRIQTKYCFAVSSVLFLCVAVGLIVQAFAQPFEMYNFAGAFFFSIVIVLYLLKNRAGWFMIVSILNIILLLASACFCTHFYFILKTASINNEIFFPVFIIPVVLIIQRILFSKSIRQEAFGLTANLSQTLRELAVVCLTIVCLIIASIQIVNVLW